MQRRALKLIQLGLFLAFLAVQQFIAPDPLARQRPLPAPVDAETIRLLSLGEAMIASRLLSFWLLTFDTRAGAVVPFESLDYERLAGWLGVIQTLDPLTAYPSITASGVFVDVRDPARARRMLEFVYRQYLKAPARRWRWLAQATMLAKYRLDDRQLALKFARALRRHAAGTDMPAWARDMEFIILQQMGELEAARAVITALLDSGAVTDPAERRFLLSRLEEIQEQRAPRRDGGA